MGKMGMALVIGVAHLACDRQPASKRAPSSPAPEPEPTKVTEASRHGLTAQQAAMPLVTIGDQVITVGDFADRLAAQSPYLQARYGSPERRREFLEHIIRFELLAQEAERRGLGSRPEVAEIEEQVMVQAMMSELFDEGAIQPESISEAELERFYGEHPDEFQAPAQVRASHILVQRRGEAETLLKTLLSDQPPGDMAAFRALAKRHNQDPDTKAIAGDLRFFGATAQDDSPGESRDLPRALREAAFSLTQIGEVYPHVIESPMGFHVLKLTAKREAFSRSFADAKRMIRNRLFREKRAAAIDAFIEELRQKADVEEDLARLSDVKAQAHNARGTSK